MKRICVFCGSRMGTRETYRAQAKTLGSLLVSRGIDLAYGGGSVGLMGVIADEVLAAGGHVTGVIPSALARGELMHEGLQELLVVDTMHTRKAKMAEVSDAFIAMPGGMGTFEELFEVLTWSQINIHSKPIGLLNVEGYYEPLLQLVDHAIEEGFVTAQNRELLMMEETAEALLDRLEEAFTANQ